MVNAINLQMTSKGDIATWKANRRKLAYSTVGTPDYVSRRRFSYTLKVGFGRLLLPLSMSLDLPRDLFAEGIRQGVRLVVPGSDHVRVSRR
jgi:hypothetical protein